jgi:hypothetical protein
MGLFELVHIAGNIEPAVVEDTAVPFDGHELMIGRKNIERPDGE